MGILIKKKQIEESKHILINSDKDSFAQASILYSYMLSLHKKVSLFSKEKDERFSFLAWFDKIRSNKPTSVDLEIDSSIEIMELYLFIKESNVKINKKMATAFYAGFLNRYNNFLGKDCDGTVFAVLTQLVELGAEQSLCVMEMTQKVPLSIFRLKSLVYERFLLKENATVVSLSLKDEDFLKTGTVWEDLFIIADELLQLAHVQEVVITKSDEKDKILKIVKEV
jgi:phosphoesterase RecJ-like protein